MSNLTMGFHLMLYGLAGVFSALILFFILIKVMMKVFPYKDEEK